MDAPLALYRRYRPETFGEVIGQDHVTEPLRNALSNNRVNHAYLFSGPRGCGKTTSARILARAMNCEQGPTPDPCGKCRSCEDLARGGPGSIDVIEIDAASHGGVDDARDLRERAFFSPVQSRFKVYIIDEAHMVTTQGFNALLKLVEEPPPHLKFIFATTEPDKVIGTIRSRTHHYPIRLVPPKLLADYLAQLCESEQVAIEPAVLPLVVRAGAGSVRDSLSVLDQLIGGAGPDGVTYQLAVALLGFTPDSLLDACVDGFAAHDSGAVFEVIDKVIDTGQDPKRFAEDLLRRLRDLVIVSAVPTATTSGLIDVAADQAERLQTQAAGLGPAELTRAADIVAAGLLEMRGATAPRLQLELICAKVLLPGADDSTNGIHARLDRIERRMTLGASPAAATPGADQPPTADLATTTSRPRRGSGGASDVPAGESAGFARSANGAEPSPRPEQPGAPQPGAERPATGQSEPPPGAERPGAEQSGTGQSGTGQSGTGRRGPQRPGTESGTEPRAEQSEPGSAAGSEPSGAAEPTADRVSGESASGSPSQPSSGPGGPESVASQGAVGQIGLADVRRLWPAILQRVKERKKVTWVMLSQNAQVLAMDDQVLTVGLTHAGVRENFVRSGHDEILRAALLAELLVDRRIEAVVDPSSGSGSGSGSGSPDPAPATVGSPGSGHSVGGDPWGANGAPAPGPAPGTDPADPSQGPQSSGGNPAAGSAGPNGSGGSAAGRGAEQAGGAAGRNQNPKRDANGEHRAPATSKRRAAQAAVAQEVRQAAQRSGSGSPGDPIGPEDEADVIGEDDVVLADDSRSHTDLLRQALGAEVIEEPPND